VKNPCEKPPVCLKLDLVDVNKALDEEMFCKIKVSFFSKESKPE